jgi:hypothetical protein
MDTPTGDRTIVALDPATGREIWQHDLGQVGAGSRRVVLGRRSDAPPDGPRQHV